MKNLFKLGLLSVSLTISLTSCDFFSNRHSAGQLDSPKKDSISIDSPQTTKQLADSTSKTTDTSKISGN